MSNIKLVHSGGNSVSLTTPTSNPASNITFKLPQADGSANQVLQTDGSGALSFTTPMPYQKISSGSSTSTVSSFIIDNIFKHQTFKSYLVTIDHIAFILITNLF